MASVLERLIVELVADDKQLRQTLQAAVRESEQSASRISRGFQRIGQDLRSLGGSVGALVGSGGLVFGLTQAAKAAQQAEVGMRLLTNQLQRGNQDVRDGVRAIQALSDELGVVPEQIADNVTQLLRQGLTIDQITTAFRGAAASALAAGRDVQTGISGVTQAIVNQQSIFLNQVGIAENLNVAYKDFARSIGVSVDELTKQQRALAAVQLVTQATREEVADLDTLLGGLTGTQNRLNRELNQAQIAFGNVVREGLTPLLNVATQVVGAFNSLPDPVQRVASGATIAAGAVTALATAVGLLATVLGPLAGPTGLIILAASAIGALVAALTGARNEVDPLTQSINSFKDALVGAGSRESLADAALQLAENLDDELASALEAFSERVRTSTEDVQALRNELSQLSEEAIRAQIAANEAQLATVTARIEQLGAQTAPPNINEFLRQFVTQNNELIDALDRAGLQFGEFRGQLGAFDQAGSFIPAEQLVRALRDANVQITAGIVDSIQRAVTLQAPGRGVGREFTPEELRLLGTLERQATALETQNETLNQTLRDLAAAREAPGTIGAPTPTEPATTQRERETATTLSASARALLDSTRDLRRLLSTESDRQALVARAAEFGGRQPVTEEEILREVPIPEIALRIAEAVAIPIPDVIASVADAVSVQIAPTATRDFTDRIIKFQLQAQRTLREAAELAEEQRRQQEETNRLEIERQRLIFEANTARAEEIQVLRGSGEAFHQHALALSANREATVDVLREWNLLNQAVDETESVLLAMADAVDKAREAEEKNAEAEAKKAAAEAKAAEERRLRANRILSDNILTLAGAFLSIRDRVEKFGSVTASTTDALIEASQSIISNLSNLGAQAAGSLPGIFGVLGPIAFGLFGNLLNFFLQGFRPQEIPTPERVPDIVTLDSQRPTPSIALRVGSSQAGPAVSTQLLDFVAAFGQSVEVFSTAVGRFNAGVRRNDFRRAGAEA